MIAPTGAVTFLFTDIERSTWLVQHLGDRWDEVLHSHHRLLRGVWEQHGGYEVSTDGDAFFVAFASAEVAIGAAVDAQRALSAYEWPARAEVRIRIGAHTGEARLYDGDYVGFAVHLAARIASAAHGGQIIVSQQSRELVPGGSGLDFVDLGVHSLKDIAEPVQLYHVVAPGLRSRFPPPRTWTAIPNKLARQPVPPVTVGRDLETVVVRDLVMSTSDLQGGAVLVEGEAGAGKTHLLMIGAARAEHVGVWVAYGAGRELERDRPFGLFVELCRSVPGLAGEARALFEESTGPYDLVESVAGLIERASADKPLLLVVDDLQWGDPSSLAVLARVVEWAPSLPVAVLGAYRPLPRSASLAAFLRGAAVRSTFLHLGPLVGEAVAQLAGELLGLPAGPRLLEQALRCGGNPLFVTELVASLKREGLVDMAGGTAEIVTGDYGGTPPALSMLLLRHLSLLPAETLAALQAGAILGTAFNLDDLAAVTRTRPSELLSLLRAAIEAELIVPAGEDLAFRHDLVHQAVYQDLGEPVRRALHGQTAQALIGAGRPVSEVAGHIMAAARPGDVQAQAHLLAAGREATPRDPEAAVSMLARAAECVGPGSALWGAIQLALGQALAAAGRLSEAETQIRRLLALASDEALEAEAQAVLGEVLHLRADFDAAARELYAASSRPELDPARRGRLRAHAVMDRAWSGDTTGVVKAAAECISNGERLGDALTCFYGVMAQASVARQNGALSAAADLSAQAGRIALGVSPAAEATHYEMPPVSSLIDVDRFDDAEFLLSSTPAWREERGGAVQPMRLHQQMRCHLFRGQWDDAIADGETALALAEQSGTAWVTRTTLGLLAIVAARRDNLSAAQDFLRRAKASRPTIGELETLLAGAYVASVGGDAELASTSLAALHEMLIVPNATGVTPSLVGESVVPTLRNWGGLIVDIQLQKGRRAAAAEVADRVEDLANQSTGVASLTGMARLCRGLVQQDPHLLQEAVETLRKSPRIADLAHACEAASTVGAPHDLLVEALNIYEGLGARWDADRVNARLRALGIRRGSRARRARPSTGWASLTPTEVRVAQAVCDGLLYREVAARLFVSPRTVETHVAHIFAKLGCRSRAELVRTVRQQLAQQPP